MASPTKLLSIPFPVSKLKNLQRLADESGLTLEDLAKDALLAYERRSRQTRDLKETFEAIQDDVRRKGVKLTKREIDAEIKAAREEMKQKQQAPKAS